MIKAILIHFSNIFISYLLLFRKQSKQAYFLNILISLWFIYIIFNYAPWSSYGSAYLKYVHTVIFIFELLLSFKYSRIIDKTKLPLTFKIVKYFCKGILILFLTSISIEEVGSKISSKSKYIELDFPLKNGNFYITSGGNNSLLNYHKDLKDEFYHKAFDISKLGLYGNTNSSNIFSFANNNKEVYIFSDSVFSPCDGIVEAVIRSEPDHQPGNLNDFNKLQANAIKIKTDDYFVELVHFKQNTIVVDTSDYVEKGDFIGLIGNSGHSSSPHLHIHSMDENLKPVEIIFGGEKYKKNDIIKIE